MLDTGKVVSLENDSPYFSEGDSCLSIALIGMGSVAVYKIGDNGRTIVLYRVGPGQFCILSTSCMFSRKTLPAHAKAESFTEAVIFPVSYFRAWIDADRVLRDFIIDTIYLYE